MLVWRQIGRKSIHRSISFFTAILFICHLILPTCVLAQSADALFMPPPGTMVGVTAASQPLMLIGIMVHPEDSLLFDFIFNTGDTKFEGEALRQESGKIIKYFLAALTIPEEHFWVNLSPAEQNRIVEPDLGQTITGRDLLAQDYLLKQLAASLSYPESELGQKFWNELYAQGQGDPDGLAIDTNVFHKVWVTANTAEVWDRGNSAFVIDGRMKVLLEEDYLSQKQDKGATPTVTAIQEEPGSSVAAIMRKILIPVIEREVNQSPSFTALRQIYHAVILAEWFKRTLRQNLLSRIYVGQSKTNGMDLNDKKTSQKIYAQYMESLRKGAYNIIKEDEDLSTGERLPRHYFSGGIPAGIGVAEVFVANAVPSDGQVAGIGADPLLKARVILVEDDEGGKNGMSLAVQEENQKQKRELQRILSLVARSFKELIDPDTGIPYDHIRVHASLPDKVMEKGLYSSPSKWSVYVPALLGIIKGKANLDDPSLNASWARDTLERFLSTYAKFVVDNPAFGGISGWGENKNGEWRSYPSIQFLDMGLFVWALQGAVGGLMDSTDPQDQRIVGLLENILKSADLSKFYDSRTGLLYGELDYKKGAWVPRKTYVIQDFNEHIMGVLFAVLHGQVPRSIWDNLPIPVKDEALSDGQIVTRFSGYEGSFHELGWPLLYLGKPLMSSRLAFLYKNFLRVHADRARQLGLRGFFATGFTAQGYQHIGINDPSSLHTAMMYATAMAFLIDEKTAMHWLSEFVSAPHIITSLGPLESTGLNASSSTFSADSVFSTFTALMEGISPEVGYYLKSHFVPGTKMTMYTMLEDLLEQKYQQVLRERQGAPLLKTTTPYSLPAIENVRVAQSALLMDKGQKALEQDLSIVTREEVGGVAFNDVGLHLQIKRDKNGVPWPVDQQQISKMKIKGFIPVILNIAPV
ncbi:MAG: hypothetical protein HQL21_07105, partial [Candidatus Omnitrophica bacterium]|nr:hypothetical protein [Candidatus Omnitrophota bacterium]